MLSIKLKHLDSWNNRRREIAKKYHAGLKGLPGLSLLPSIEGTDPIWHIYPVFPAKRDEFRAALEKHGVQSGVHYPKPVHLQPAYAHLGVAQGSLPNSERAASTEISLPMFPELTDAEADQVIAGVAAAARDLA